MVYRLIMLIFVNTFICLRLALAGCIDTFIGPHQFYKPIDLQTWESYLRHKPYPYIRIADIMVPHPTRDVDFVTSGPDLIIIPKAFNRDPEYISLGKKGYATSMFYRRGFLYITFFDTKKMTQQLKVIEVGGWTLKQLTLGKVRSYNLVKNADQASFTRLSHNAYHQEAIITSSIAQSKNMAPRGELSFVQFSSSANLKKNLTNEIYTAHGQTPTLAKRHNNGRIFITVKGSSKVFVTTLKNMPEASGYQEEFFLTKVPLPGDLTPKKKYPVYSLIDIKGAGHIHGLYFSILGEAFALFSKPSEPNLWVAKFNSYQEIRQNPDRNNNIKTVETSIPVNAATDKNRPQEYLTHISEVDRILYISNGSTMHWELNLK